MTHQGEDDMESKGEMIMVQVSPEDAYRLAGNRRIDASSELFGILTVRKTLLFRLFGPGDAAKAKRLLSELKKAHADEVAALKQWALDVGLGEIDTEPVE